MIKAIDLSHHNGKIDFGKVKGSGIDTVIIRTGYGKALSSQTDRRFEEYYSAAKAAGMNVGAYHYSYADSISSAQEEAAAMLEIVKGKKFELPLFFDIEEPKHSQLDKKLCSDIVRTFCDKLEKAGYWAGVYSYDAFFGSNLTEDIVKRYTTWVARVENVKPHKCIRYDIWQYSWKGRVDGIDGNVDMDMVYKDFPQLIKAAHLNGF